MKMYFAAAAIALVAAAPSYAQSVMSEGRSVQEVCFRGAHDSQTLSQRSVSKAIAACNTALSDDQSALARAGTLANRGTLQVALHNDDAAVADFNAALSRNPNLAPAYMSRGAV